MALDLLIWIVFPASVVLAASMDLFTMTIPNRISIFLILSFFIMAPIVGLSWEQFASHLAAAGLVLAICFACFAFGWMGGGDAKLATSVALWFGFEYLLDYALLASIAGGVLTFLLLTFRVNPLPHFLLQQGWLMRLHDEKEGIPYGVALGLTALFVYPSTFWMAALSA